jgi:hypothetical protein
MGLSLEEHRDLGSLLKRAVRDLEDAAAITRCYERTSRQLRDAANALMSQRTWLEQRLIDAVGEERARDVYFGEEREDA